MMNNKYDNNKKKDKTILTLFFMLSILRWSNIQHISNTRPADDW